MSNRNEKISNFERGFGLVEVIIATAILSIVALGITTLVEDMLRVQKKTSTVGVINNMRTLILSSVQNGRSWELTVANVDATTGNPYMECLRGGPAVCTDTTVTALSLLDINGTLVYNALAANHGFGYDGVICSSYPSDACPFKWLLTWTASCPNAAATCLDPNVIVTGRLEYTPGSQGSLPGGFNPALYRIDIVRGGDAIRNDPVTVSYMEADASGEGSGCEGASWVTRKLNTVVADPAGNLMNKVGAAVNPADQIQLRAGTYNCRIQSPAFKNGGNRLQLRRTAGTSFPTVSSSAATASMNGGSANLLIEATLVLNADTTFVIEQKCTSLPSATGFGSVNDNWSLGVPVPGPSGTYTDVTYTTVSCTRTS